MPSGLLIECHQNAKMAARVLQLPFRKKVWRGLSGVWQGKESGSSIDFRDHRPYLPGDDPRHINWQAYARSGHYSMKVYQEEVRPHVDLVLDTSGSMACGLQKERRSLELFYYCLENAWRSGATLRVYLANADRMEAVDPGDLLHHVWKPSWSQAGENALPRLNDARWNRGGMRLLVSDLLFQGEPGDFLSRFAQTEGLSLILAPFSAAEASPEWRGNLEFIDCETGKRRKQLVAETLLKRYLANYERHFDWWYRQCLRYGGALARVNAELSLVESLKVDALRGGILEMAG